MATNVDPITTANNQAEQDKAEIARLRSTHELYQQYKPLWDFYLTAYEGGPDFAKKDNLFRHVRETEEDYKDRAQRIHYTNYCAPLVDFFTRFIFAETIQRDGGTNKPFYNDFLNDVNFKGDDVEAFMSEVCDDMQIFGMSYVLVDAPQIPDGITLTKAQEQKMNIRPYWVSIRPTEILDWVTDEFDKYQYVKRQQFVSELKNGQKQKLERYTEWTPKSVTITDIDVTNDKKPLLLPARTITNRLDLVPLECFRFKRSKANKFMGNSFLRDLASQNKEVMNLTSLLQEFLYRQCFNILAQEMDSSVPFFDQQNGDVGSANILYFPKGAKAPQYIAPSSDPADKISGERSTIIQEMYRRAAEDTVNELFNGHKSSGYSKQQSFKNTVPQIATRADILEDGEERLMALTLKYMGKTWDGTVKYKDHYEITSLTDALAQMTTLFKDLQIKSDTFVRTEMKRMVHEFDGKLTEDQLAKVEAEIDAMDMTEWFDTQKLAYIGKAAQSPEAALALGDGKTAISGKDKTGAQSPTRATSSTTEIQSESSKRPLNNGRKK